MYNHYFNMKLKSDIMPFVVDNTTVSYFRKERNYFLNLTTDLPAS